MTNPCPRVNGCAFSTIAQLMIKGFPSRWTPGPSWAGRAILLRTKARTFPRILSRSYLPAAIAFVVITTLGLYAERQHRVLAAQSARAELLAEINVIRAKLEGNVAGDIQLVRGLIATIMTEPAMTHARFTELARNVLVVRSQLRLVAGAPGMVVRMIYPVEGNEAVLGLNYIRQPDQVDMVLLARDTGRLVVAGPLDLRQGGVGIVARFPVHLGPEHGNRFWGIVSAVIDVERLYRESGLYDSPGLDIALTGVDAAGHAGAQFFGDPSIRAQAPVTAQVSLPYGSWQIAAVPKAGWDPSPGNTWLIRGLIAFAIVTVVVPIALAGRFHEERSRNYVELRRSERRLRQLSQRLELALDASRIGVWVLDLDTWKSVWDARLHDLYGIPYVDGVRNYTMWKNCVHPDDLAMAEQDFFKAVENHARYSSQYRIVRPDGSVRHIRTHATLTRDPHESPKMIGAEWDVTDDVALNQDLEKARVLAESRSAELESAKARIEFNALHDSLTGLPNRRFLDERLAQMARRCASADNRIGILHIDLDRFKQINDTLGHAAGDAMLMHVSHVLKQNVRHGDFVARIGGDEFVVLCADDPSTGALKDVADRIIARMRQPVAYQGHQCRFGVSIGIAEDGGSAIDPARLLINADIALYRAKSRGRNRHELFNETLQAEIVRGKRLADDILRGLENDEFIVYYQPQFDARSQELAGVEALVRWNHPTDGILAPGGFLSMAEELGVVDSLDEIVLRKALADFARWKQLGLHVPRISVNVSARRLRDEELFTSLQKLDIEPGVLSFELLESIFLDDTDEVVAANVDRIKELGIDIEIDDFGTGYASIVSLLKLRPRAFKIDRQLIAPLRESVKQRNLVKSLIEIGRTLGIEVVAEGVETMEHARILKRIGCDKLQGHVFGHAVNAAAFEASLVDRRRAAS